MKKKKTTSFNYVALKEKKNVQVEKQKILPLFYCRFKIMALGPVAIVITSSS